ncbi:MAG: 50S ribosomal protein L29 [Bacteroidetes bacterium]|nr:MAG: 50S ribosomal protein L29 [Bacteroidota bacterium]
MTAKEIRELSSEEIAEHIRDEQEQLTLLRFQHEIADLQNPMVLRDKRRLIGRLSTILNSRKSEELTN